MALRVFLYDARGHDREIELDRAVLAGLDEHSLLWIDLDGRDDREIGQVADALALTGECLRSLTASGEPTLENYGTFFRLAVEAAPQHAPAEHDDADPYAPPFELAPGHAAQGARVDFIVGKGWLVTVHDEPVQFLNRFREQDKAETVIGLLTPQALAASLLDWHLGAFFEEVSRIEATVDRLDEKVLREATRKGLLGRMVAIRRRVARLRRLLVRQRDIFYGLSRPDFALITDAGATPFYEALANRFERALDEVERARDLVTGSFELFTSRSSEQTNDLVKVLTFLTAIIGFCAAVAGLFGMNFDPQLFNTGLTGFLTVTGSLLLISIVSVIIARHRGWI
jgi:Mg2+ and Co2+ transporter CorA